MSQCNCNVSIPIDYNKLIFDINYGKTCPKVWEMLAEGKTKGVFQLESFLGHKWCQSLKPSSIDDMAALISMIRPGVLESVLDGKNLAQHYVDRKHNKEEVISIHDSLNDILGDTYHILLYQEQTLAIAKKLAGFSEEEADILRKGLGQKLPEVIAKIKVKFLEGTKKVGIVNEQSATQIFDWVEKGQRYLFNRCISGRHIIRRFPNSQNNNLSIAEMFNIRNDIRYAQKTKHLSLYREWKINDNYGYGLSLDVDGQVRKNLIKDIRFIGIKDVLQIKTSSKKTIIVTENHKFPTKNGIKTAGYLTNKDYLYICTEYNPRIEGRDYPSYYEKISSVKPFGEDEVYDVEMEGPNHTFVIENNIITCNSHAIEYGIIGYLTAWVKYHYPLEFFSSWLKFAREKIKPAEEIRELIEEAKKFDISVLPPTLNTLLKNDSDIVIDDKIIRFGMQNMKGIGRSAIDKLHNIIKEGEEISWSKTLLTVLPQLNKQTATALISGGVFDSFGISRNRMLFEFDKLKLLTKRQLGILVQENRGLEGLDKVEEAVNKNQKKKINDIRKLLEDPNYSTKDRISWIIIQEKDIYGVPITYDPIDQLKFGTIADTTCKEFLEGKDGHICLCGEIQNYRKFKIKNGPNKGKVMASFRLNDGTASCDCLVFHKIFPDLENNLYENNLVALKGKKSYNSKSFVVDSMEDLF